MTSDLLIAKSNKPFSDLILFDHTIAFHAVYLSLVPGAHMWLFLPLRMPASPAPPQPYPCASLRKAHLLHASDSHFTEPCSSSLFLSISMIASSNSLLKAISLPYFPSPFFFSCLLFWKSFNTTDMAHIYILPTIGKHPIIYLSIFPPLSIKHLFWMEFQYHQGLLSITISLRSSFSPVFSMGVAFSPESCCYEISVFFSPASNYRGA